MTIDPTHHHWASATVKMTAQDGIPTHWSADCTCGLKEEGEGSLPLKYVEPWIIDPGQTVGTILRAAQVHMTKPVIKVFGRDGNALEGRGHD